METNRTTSPPGAPSEGTIRLRAANDKLEAALKRSAAKALAKNHKSIRTNKESRT